MVKDKGARSKDKKARRRHETEVVQARLALLKTAYAFDAAGEMAAFNNRSPRCRRCRGFVLLFFYPETKRSLNCLCCRFKADGTSISLTWESAGSLSQLLKERIRAVLEENMADVYAEDWPKARAVKDKEMAEDDARYLIAWDCSNKLENQNLAAFIQYR